MHLTFTYQGRDDCRFADDIFKCIFTPSALGRLLSSASIKWDVAVHGRDIYLLKPTLGPPKKFQYIARAEEVVITRLRICHTKATKSHILSRGPLPTCQTLTIDHMLLVCAVLQESRDEYYTADSLNTLFDTIPESCIVEFLRKAGFFNLIWTVRRSIQSLTWTVPKLMQFF